MGAGRLQRPCPISVHDPHPVRTRRNLSTEGEDLCTNVFLYRFVICKIYVVGEAEKLPGLLEVTRLGVGLVAR